MQHMRDVEARKTEKEKDRQAIGPPAGGGGGGGGGDCDGVRTSL